MLAGCGMVEQHYKLRFRLTLEVETPSGLRSGSGILEVITVLSPIWAPGPQTILHLNGEAVPVDLPNGETLFAVLHGGRDLTTLPRRTFAPLINVPAFERGGRTHYDVEKQTDFVMSAKPAAEVAGDEIPLLVRFGDLRDPLTVEEVDPRDLAAVFGPGYRLRRVTIQVTDAPVTRAIATRLPWLETMQPGSFSGKSIVTSSALVENLGPRAFSTEN